MIRRTIKPAEVDSRVSAEDAASAARLVYRDRTTGRFVILKNEFVVLKNDRTVHGRSGKRVQERACPPDAAKHAKVSRVRHDSEPVAAKKR